MILEKANARIEECYRRMRACNSTSGRKYNYLQIQAVIQDNPLIENYWRIECEQRYIVDRVVAYRNLTSNDELRFRFQNGIHCAYIMLLEESNKLKVGKTSNSKDRYRQLTHQYGQLHLLHYFIFDTEHQAEMMEAFMKGYFKRKHFVWVKQDRFESGICTAEDVAYFEKIAITIKNLK